MSSAHLLQLIHARRVELARHALGQVRVAVVVRRQQLRLGTEGHAHQQLVVEVAFCVVYRVALREVHEVRGRPRLDEVAHAVVQLPLHARRAGRHVHELVHAVVCAEGHSVQLWRADAVLLHGVHAGVAVAVGDDGDALGGVGGGHEHEGGRGVCTMEMPRQKSAASGTEVGLDSTSSSTIMRCWSPRLSSPSSRAAPSTSRRRGPCGSICNGSGRRGGA